MKNSKLSIATLLILGSIAFSATELVPNAHAQNSLQLFLFAPDTASPGQTVPIELWTIYENTTSGRPDLAFNATGQSATTCSVFPCLTFLVKINLGISAPPHIHTPSGGFVALAAFKQWVHPGAWNTSYTVPSQLGLYGVHMYANYTIKTGPSSYTSYVSQAQTAFTVKNTPATPADVTNGVSGLATASNLTTLQDIAYGVLGLVIVAIILDLVILVWKKSPTKPQ